MKSRIFLLSVLTLVVLGLLSGSIQQSAEQLYQSGIYKEEVEGELEKAISIYEQILADFPENKDVAAKALYHIGLCYEKLGNQEAEKAYQRLIHEYPGQIKEVNLAKERLSSLGEKEQRKTQKPHFQKIQIPITLADGAQLSPNGKKLTFSSERYEGSIWQVPIPGKVGPDLAGEPKKLTEEEGAWCWGHVWSADGKWIAYNYMKNQKDIFVDEIRVIPSQGGQPKKIAVPVNRGGGFHLYQYCISLSPDGKLLAYSSRETEESGKPNKSHSYIYTIPADGGTSKRLTDAKTWMPAFSPDGKKIAYVKESDSKEGKPVWNIWVTPVSEGTPVQVSHLSGRAISPVWSPDGRMIAFLRDLKGDYSVKEVWIVPVTKEGKPTSSPTKIDLPLKTSLRLAGWTSDSKIGILLRKPIHEAIYTVPSNGGKATQVTAAGGSCPSWSPDGERIFFLGDDSISSIPYEGGKVSTIPGAGGFEARGFGPCVSPDGKRIVFPGRKEKEGTGIHLWTIPIEGGQPTPITKSPGTDVFPSWTPDGKHIVFTRQEKKPDGKTYKTNLYIISAEGGDVKQLTFPTDEHIAEGKWSPDGKFFAYQYSKMIKVISAEGGKSKVLVELNKEDNIGHYLTWSPDSKEIAYTVNGKIYAVSLDAEAREIETGLSSDSKAFHLSWSPDGKKIAFAARKGGELELWMMEDFLPLVKR